MEVTATLWIVGTVCTAVISVVVGFVLNKVLKTLCDVFDKLGQVFVEARRFMKTKHKDKDEKP